MKIADSVKLTLFMTSNGAQRRPRPQERSERDFIFKIAFKVKVSHCLIAVGAVVIRVPLYLGHS